MNGSVLASLGGKVLRKSRDGQSFPPRDSPLMSKIVLGGWLGAYIVAPARNMIYKYIIVIPQKKSRFVQFKPAMCFRVTAAIGIGNGLRFQCMEL